MADRSRRSRSSVLARSSSASSSCSLQRRGYGRRARVLDRRIPVGEDTESVRARRARWNRTERSGYRAARVRQWMDGAPTRMTTCRSSSMMTMRLPDVVVVYRRRRSSFSARRPTPGAAGRERAETPCRSPFAVAAQHLRVARSCCVRCPCSNESPALECNLEHARLLSLSFCRFFLCRRFTSLYVHLSPTSHAKKETRRGRQSVCLLVFFALCLT